ncbi:hypothetical protein SAMN05428988_3159 [Chitinophaga sp. YR573]|nr:hypothetical protein SAMN05428988_3159 [Chitinophaga sp. YR573]
MLVKISLIDINNPDAGFWVTDEYQDFQKEIDFDENILEKLNGRHEAHFIATFFKGTIKIETEAPAQNW